jgi:hypothetical protein
MATIGPPLVISMPSQLEDHSLERPHPPVVLALVGTVAVMNVLSAVLSLMV